MNEEFRIDDIKSLEWYLKKVRETELEIETIKSQSAAMLKEALRKGLAFRQKPLLEVK